MNKTLSEEISRSELAPHPEEMKSTVELRIGRVFSLQATARTTPAGIVSVGIALSLAVLAFSALARARRMRNA
ncbi:MYXO-CTERM sorting domain-containing protein [uncultured Methylovirgula sp.]|uniref:MYXO-CTERM sorting domain-containing protein n=1 Tax=uncultured Methylovirgula sp. TaxID=1285960 RepID=UPI002625B56D|nr:MYXO-CTERM sorting domain-containing protein [uncultured Methylovirgula sp.]